MTTQSAADAGFFSLVHDVLAAEKEHASDRRDELRQAYECLQLIAPYEEGRLPAASEFHRVRCQDLSPGGMSYIDGQPPAHRNMLVLLGPAPFIFLTAEIAHHSEIQTEAGKEFLIGCRFTGRIKQDVAALAS
jgi:hypothetical protein